MKEVCDGHVKLINPEDPNPELEEWNDCCITGQSSSLVLDSESQSQLTLTYCIDYCKVLFVTS